MARWAVVPMPVEPMSSAPGFWRAQCSMSATLVQGLSAGTSRPKVVLDTCRMGIKSLTGSQGTGFMSAWRNTVMGSWPRV